LSIVAKGSIPKYLHEKIVGNIVDEQVSVFFALDSYALLIELNQLFTGVLIHHHAIGLAAGYALGALTSPITETITKTFAKPSITPRH